MTRAPAPVPPRPVGRPLVDLGVIATYVALSCAAFAHLLGGHRLFGTGADSILATWFLDWVPHSLAHGLNPFFSHAIYVPQGVNLAQNTESPLLGLLTVPLAPLLDPVQRGDLLMVLAMPVSATSAFLVLRAWRVWRPAAALGGLIYGFSPYAVGQGLGHLVLMFVPLPPLIAWATVELVRPRAAAAGARRWRVGLLLGLLVAAQYLSEPEIAVDAVLLTAAALGCVALARPRRAAAAARVAAAPVALGATLAAVALAYPIGFLLAGPQVYHGTAQPAINPYFNDLLTFVHPGPLQRAGLGLRHLHVGFSNPSEYDGYLGWPLLAVTSLLAVVSRRRPRTLAALTLTGCAAVLSLGRRLTVDGHVTVVRLPFAVVARIPLVSNVLASRMSLVVAMGVAAVVAFGLDDLATGTARRGRHVQTRLGGPTASVAGAVALAAVVVGWWPVWPYATQPVRALPGAVTRAIPAGTPVAVTYPYASPLYPQPMLWQMQDHMAFDLIGGYSEHPDPSGQPTGLPDPIQPPGLEAFLDGQEGYNPYLPPVPITPGLVGATHRALVANRVGLVLVDQRAAGAAGVVDLFTRVLGPAPVVAGGFAAWAAPAGHHL